MHLAPVVKRIERISTQKAGGLVLLFQLLDMQIRLLWPTHLVRYSTVWHAIATAGPRLDTQAGATRNPLLDFGRLIIVGAFAGRVRTRSLATGTVMRSFVLATEVTGENGAVAVGDKETGVSSTGAGVGGAKGGLAGKGAAPRLYKKIDDEKELRRETKSRGKRVSGCPAVNNECLRT